MGFGLGFGLGFDHQVHTWRKKVLEGWSGMTTFLPMASASAVAVHSTSLVLGFTKTR